MKSPAEALWCTQTVFLSKQVLTIVTGRCSDGQSFWSLYTSKVVQFYKQYPLAQKGLRAWLVLFLENMLPLQQQIKSVEEIGFPIEIFINLIQHKPNLKLFNSLPFYQDNDSINEILKLADKDLLKVVAIHFTVQFTLFIKGLQFQEKKIGESCLTPLPSINRFGETSLEADQSIFKMIVSNICLSHTFSHSPPYFRYSAVCYFLLSFHT